MSQLDEIQEWQVQHEKDDTIRFGEISRTLTDMKENHLAHMQIATETLATDLRWVKWLVMGIAAGIGLLALKQLGV